MEYGLIGQKLSHSFSKTVHSLIADYSYELKELNDEELSTFFETRDFKGVNVTIPYKKSVIKYLDFVSEIALKIGAVNTVVNNGGKLYGYNTDYYGLKSMLKFYNVDLKGKKVLLLGSGGTSKTAQVLANDLGADSVYVVSRTAGEGVITYSQAETIHNDADIIINTTPVGMYPDNYSSVIKLDKFKRLSCVVDVIYNPLKSKLIVSAENMGIKAYGGLYMLISQAVSSAEKFLSESFSFDICNDIFCKIMSCKQNIVLIGMPGSGKTTYGEKLADKLSKSFVDTDIQIEKALGHTPFDIIEKWGEKYFRKIESDVVLDVSKKQSMVIATGGGVVLDSNNIAALKQNGVIVFLDRPLEKLNCYNDRPLANTTEKLTKMYNERYELYKSYCDFSVKVQNFDDSVLDEIIRRTKIENSCH